MKKSLLLYFLLAIAFPSLSQTSVKDSTKLNIRFNVGLGGVSTEYFSNKIVMDEELYFNRSAKPSSFGDYFTGKLTDQPHEHGAIFSHFSSKTTFKPGYYFYANLYMEHRGESYGGNDLNNVVVTPFMYGRLRDTFNFLKKPMEIFVHIGDLINYRMAEGLQIYNMDVQGVVLQLEREGGYFFKVVHLPDVSKGIGLGLEEIFSFGIGKNFEGRHKIQFSFDYNSNMDGGRYVYFKHLSLAYSHSIGQENKLYFQMGSRSINGGFTPNTSAFLIGGNWELKNNKLKVRINPECRYYSSLYNKNYFNGGRALYRDLGNPSHYSNTVGRYLYPLKNYYYPYSQWAVFTEYRNKNILGLGLLANVEYQILPKFKASVTADFLTIQQKSSFDTPIYFFYNIDLYYEPARGLKIGGMLTNKAMNLDAHFQTFYMTRHPAIGLHVRKDLDVYW